MGGKQKKMVPINENLRRAIQQGEIRRHSYSTTMDKHIVEYRSKFFKLSRLDEIKTRFYNSRLDELAFFQDLETLKSFRTEEENTSETAKKKTSFTKKKPPDSSDESDEQSEPYSDTETIFILNKENTTEANTSFIHGGSLSLKSHTPESKGNEEDTTEAKSIFIRRSSLSLKSHTPESKVNEEENTTQAKSIFVRRSSLSLKSHMPESKGSEEENTTQANAIFVRRSSLSLKSHTPESKGNEEDSSRQANSIFVRRSSLSLKSHTSEFKKNEEEVSHSKSWKSLPQKTVGKKQAETKPKETNRKMNGDNKTCDTLVPAKNHVKPEQILEDTVKEEKISSKDEERQVLPNTSQSEDAAGVQDPSKIKKPDMMHKESGISSLPPKYEQISNSKDHGNDFGFTKDDNKKSKEHVASISDGHKADEESKARKAELTSSEKTEKSDSVAEKTEESQEASDDDIIIIDDSPPAAPFDHRIVSARKTGISSYYHVYKGEVLGGGRFGQVHKCEEKGTGLKLAAKIIKARGQKEKDEVKNEINIMNQLNHVNLIQLYDAFESKYDLTLVMEYVEGGELFDRIIDENSNLSEIDTILFIKQICEGVQYMHQMYILHLDLKPENILCVNREANQIKIIDFGLARRYKPREKLKVNFGTPEFLAPEVVNYDFVSFPTDMWSVGVIAYMLLSGLSPFLGDDDNETLNNILACRWDFEDQEFENVSEEAKDFISKLLIKAKGWRMSATASLKHPWLSDQTLHRKLKDKSNRKDPAAS